jgi:hypothetical protein
MDATDGLAKPRPELGPDSGGRPKGGAATTLKQQKQRETELASQAETAYRRLMADWHQSAKGAGATQGRASSKPSSGTERGRATVPDPAL